MQGLVGVEQSQVVDLLYTRPERVVAVVPWVQIIIAILVEYVVDILSLVGQGGFAWCTRYSAK